MRLPRRVPMRGLAMIAAILPIAAVAGPPPRAASSSDREPPMAPLPHAGQPPAAPTGPADGPAPLQAAGSTTSPTVSAAKKANTPAAGGDAPPRVAPPVAPGPPEQIVLREFLVLPRADLPGRRVVHRDPIDAALAAGVWAPPQPGDEVTSALGETLVWGVAVADAAGRLLGPETAGGYAVATIASPVERTMLLRASRHVAAWVNGVWLAGDPYGDGGPAAPVRLQEGPNTLLFQLAQPGFSATLIQPEAPLALVADDAVLPDLVSGTAAPHWAALTVVNAAGSAVVGAELRVTLAGESVSSLLPRIGPRTVRRVSFRLPKVLVPRVAPSAPATMVADAAIHPLRPDTGGVSPDPVARATIELEVHAQGRPHTRTFVSGIDGGAQPYTFLPATAGGEDAALVLALHDLGENHAEFAGSLTQQPWAHIVAPQGRRDVGFVWEDWSAADALEALADSQRRVSHDGRRLHLLGHGYGGYGARRLAMRSPGRWASVATIDAPLDYVFSPRPPAPAGRPSGGPGPDPLSKLLGRGAATRSTLKQARNLASIATLVLHRADDRRTPPEQSRALRSRLGAFHADFAYREFPNAARGVRGGGADWPDVWAFFRGRRAPRPEHVRHIDFTTAHPADAHTCHWVTLVRQATPYQTSRLTIRHDPEERTFSGRTENARRITLDLAHMSPGEPVAVTLDDLPPLRLNWPSQSGQFWLIRSEKTGRWRRSGAPGRDAKSLARPGLFKSAFGGRVQLVYGTAGDDDENRWAADKARFDAQTFYRRGGGAVEVLPDTAFRPTEAPNRNVVLYGNAKTNAAWPALLSTSPVQPRGGRVDIAAGGVTRPESGEDLTLLMVRPRLGSATASVGVVGGSGIRGMRQANRLRYFAAGVAYPDLLLLGPRATRPESPGNAGGDVRAAGYFDGDWQAGRGLLWRDIAL